LSGRDEHARIELQLQVAPRLPRDLQVTLLVDAVRVDAQRVREREREIAAWIAADVDLPSEAIRALERAPVAELAIVEATGAPVTPAEELALVLRGAGEVQLVAAAEVEAVVVPAVVGLEARVGVEGAEEAVGVVAFDRAEHVVHVRAIEVAE